MDYPTEAVSTAFTMVLHSRSPLIGMYATATDEIIGSMTKRNYKAWQSLGPSTAITLPVQALQIGGGFITSKVQKALVTGGNFS